MGRKGTINSKATTLLELIFAVTLLSVVALLVTSIQIFCRYQVVSASRLAKVQSQVSFALEHMSKNMLRAIGNVNSPAYVIAASPDGISVRTDANSNGQVDSGDAWIAYRLPVASSDLTYYANALGPDKWGGALEIISRNITNLVFSSAAGSNIVQVEITGRLDAGTSRSLDNPEVSMRTRIRLPGVSTH